MLSLNFSEKKQELELILFSHGTFTMTQKVGEKLEYFHVFHNCKVIGLKMAIYVFRTVLQTYLI